MLDKDKVTLSRIPLEAFNEGKVDVIDEVMTPDHIEHVPAPPGSPPGNEGLKAFIAGLRSAFPDFKYKLVRVVAEGDFIVHHLSAEGTMKGAFAGMPPSGKHAVWEEIHITRMSGGKAVEHWAVIDQLGMLRQLGFVPDPTTAAAKS